MEEQLPFWEMDPADELSQGADTIPLGVGRGQSMPLGPQVFAKAGEIYAVYLPTATATGSLDLAALKGTAEQRWYNPRTGEFQGERTMLSGGASRQLGPPPANPELDWVVLIRRTDQKAQ